MAKNPLDGLVVDVKIEGKITLDNIVLTHDDFMKLPGFVQETLIKTKPVKFDG